MNLNDHQLMAEFIETSDCMMYAVINLDATIRKITKSCKKILDYDPEELINQSINNYIHPEDFQNYIDFFHKNTLSKKKLDINTFVLRLKARNEEYIHVKGFAKLITDQKTSEILDFNILYVKINPEASFTDRKYLEERVKRQIELDMITLFISKVNHEIRNPLNAILGMNELLTCTRLSKEQKEYVLGIKNSGNHLLSVLNNMLDLSKIRAGKIEINLQNISINKILDQISLSFKSQIIKKKLKFKLIKLQKNHDCVSGDRKLIHQLLLNLVSNSMKFTKKGSITLEAKFENKYYFIIKDTGIGMTPEETKKIFKPYQQARKDISEIYGGTGLGLSIVKEISSLLNGELSVESEVGKGTVFMFACRLENI